MMKKISILSFCLFFISCFVEPKKTEKKTENIKTEALVNSRIKVDKKNENLSESSKSINSNSYKKFKDNEGNSYKIAIIGEQKWLIENLKVSYFRNGDIITEVRDDAEWIYCGENKIPAWCYYNNDSKNDKLYNLWAVIDERQISPFGWTIPTKENYKELINKYGGPNIAGKHLKSVRFKGGTNKSGFNAELIGSRGLNGKFEQSLQTQEFWTKSLGKGWGGDSQNISANILSLYSSRDWASLGASLMSFGYPIRCIEE